SANFFVNGFRDDVQYFRDLYNAQSVEILKGPSAITFGRASGGGLLNRTLKEADGQRIYEVTGQTGSWYDGRFTLDARQALTAFYGSPDLNRAVATVQTVMGFLDHDFGNGLTVRNGTYYASFQKFYQNVYPGNGPLAGAVNASDTSFNRAAYNHTTNRDNTF